MKCLLCKSQFQTREELKDHYITFHEADPGNYFFHNHMAD